jgi:hypothetical protein
VDFPIKNDDFHSYVSSPEGITCYNHRSSSRMPNSGNMFFYDFNMVFDTIGRYLIDFNRGDLTTKLGFNMI